MKLPNRVVAAANRRAHALAQSHYSATRARILALALELLHGGVPPEDVVALIGDHRPHLGPWPRPE